MNKTLIFSIQSSLFCLIIGFEFLILTSCCSWVGADFWPILGDLAQTKKIHPKFSWSLQSRDLKKGSLSPLSIIISSCLWTNGFLPRRQFCNSPLSLYFIRTESGSPLHLGPPRLSGPGHAMARAPRIYIQNICLRSKTGEYPAAALGNEEPSLQQNLEYILDNVTSSDIVFM